MDITPGPKQEALNFLSVPRCRVQGVEIGREAKKLPANIKKLSQTITVSKFKQHYNPLRWDSSSQRRTLRLSKVKVLVQDHHQGNKSEPEK